MVPVGQPNALGRVGVVLNDPFSDRAKHRRACCGTDLGKGRVHNAVDRGEHGFAALPCAVAHQVVLGLRLARAALEHADHLVGAGRPLLVLKVHGKHDARALAASPVLVAERLERQLPSVRKRRLHCVRVVLRGLEQATARSAGLTVGKPAQHRARARARGLRLSTKGSAVGRRPFAEVLQLLGHENVHGREEPTVKRRIQGALAEASVAAQRRDVEPRAVPQRDHGRVAVRGSRDGGNVIQDGVTARLGGSSVGTERPEATVVPPPIVGERVEPDARLLRLLSVGSTVPV